jgi:hypothetical protein
MNQLAPESSSPKQTPEFPRNFRGVGRVASKTASSSHRIPPLHPDTGVAEKRIAQRSKKSVALRAKKFRDNTSQAKILAQKKMHLHACEFVIEETSHIDSAFIASSSNAGRDAPAPMWHGRLDRETHRTRKCVAAFVSRSSAPARRLHVPRW